MVFLSGDIKSLNAMAAHLQKWSIPFFLLLSCQILMAQQEISVRVQVNRLPGGAYPTKVYQLNATPGLVMVTITNHTSTAYTLYLNGMLTGDNGVQVATAKGYIPGTIDIAPLQTKVLNAVEAGNLFNENYLVYLNGSTSIKSSVFGEQGLPEGTYQVCVRAFDAATKKPLSGEDPIGCSNIFTVSTLEPPTILNPFSGSFVRADKVQNIPLRWTTPPGAPPSIEYTIRIVEIFGDRNPNDAILSSPTPFFETTVKGTPILLYSMQYPRLQEGRSYAMMVTASDPLGSAVFRNQGRSEVIRFTYSNDNPDNVPWAQDAPPEGADYSTHTLTGRLLWAFKATEQGSAGIAQAGMNNVSQAKLTLASTRLASAVANTPLLNYNVLAAVNADPTLHNNVVQPQLPSNLLYASAASLNECTYEQITPGPATENHPMAAVNFTLSGVMQINLPFLASSNTTLLATGKTDPEGNFSINFLDPSFQPLGHYSELLLSVETTDFENSVFHIPASAFNGKDAVDLGSFLLVAKTYRFFPKVILDNDTDPNGGGYGFHIYREISETETRPWLLNEGQAGGATGQVIQYQGKQMVEIAADSVSGGTTVKGAGRIFFGGNLYVQINPSGAGYYPISSLVSVAAGPIPSNEILLATATYHPTLQPAHIEGTVALPLAGQSTLPVQRAVVRVLYPKDKVVTPPFNPPPAQSMFPAVAGAAPVNMTSINSVGARFTTTPAVYLTTQAPGGNPIANPATLVGSAVYDLAHPIPDGFAALTAATDELGNYYIGNLPVLKDNAAFSVEVISTPSEFATFTIRPKNGGESPVQTILPKGASARIDFTIDADVADVVGRVVDADGKPLANARVSFKGNTLSATGPDGVFQFKIYPGSHTISLEKEGYVTTEVPISIPQLTGNASADKAYQTQWRILPQDQRQTATLQRVSQSVTVQGSVARGNIFSASMFGMAAAVAGNASGGAGSASGGAGVTQYNSSLARAFGIASDYAQGQYESPRQFAIDMKDVGYLHKISGKARFRVLDADGSTPIAGATIHLFDTSHVTDASGEWHYEGFGGAATLTVVPPAGSSYIPLQETFNLAETGVETLVSITLQKGVKITGRVSSGGQALPATRILLDDKDLAGITTDANGNYTLYATAGEHSVGARKQNYVGQDKDQGIPAAGATIDFDLKGGNGRNYGTLLGFPIELSAVETVGGSQEKWSGSFINLQTVSPGVFSLPANTRIPFSDLLVSFDAGGNASPQNNMVKTDLSVLPFKLFGYLPVDLSGEDVVTFTRAADGSGQLSGKIKVDLNAIQGYRGWSMNDNVSLLVTGQGGAADKIVVCSSAFQPPAAANSYTLVSANGAATGQLYGFAITLDNNALVGNDGLQFTGSITTPSLGAIQSVNIGMKQLAFNRALAVSAAIIRSDNLPSLSIGGWTAAMNALIFNEDGFRAGGSLSLPVPRSGTSQVSFSDLCISPHEIFGGSFSIPAAGIDILSVANLNTGGEALSFGRVGNSSVYSLRGKASLKVNVGVTEKPFDVPLFEVRTNGDFSIQSPSSYKTSIGPFEFNVSNLYINTTDNSPYIGIQGGFVADLDVVRFDLADIKVRASASGPTYSVEKLGVNLDVPVVKTEAYVTFKDDGFEGDGSLSIPATPIAGSISFRYYKHPSGTELGAHFSVNIPPIPIGVLVTLDGVGGGFDYSSGGPNGGFVVDLNCKLSFLGTGPVVAIDPLGIKVSSAGILTGYGDIRVGTYLSMGHAETVFDGPNSTFTVQILANISPIKGLAEQEVKGALIISAKKGDEFAFLGCKVQAKILGLIDNEGLMAVAIRLKNPKTRGGPISDDYFANAPDDYVQSSFTGVYINVATQLGIPEDHPAGFDITVASAKLWCISAFHATLLLNLDDNACLIRFGGKFNGGLEACVADIACVRVGAGLCYQVEGGRNDLDGWNFAATATGRVSVGFGIGLGDCDPGCNEVVTVWDGCVGGAFQVCANASLDFGFSERNGLKFKVRAGGDDSGCD